MMDEEWIAQFQAAIRENPEQALYDFIWRDDPIGTPDPQEVVDRLTALGEEGEYLRLHYGGLRQIMWQLEDWAEEYISLNLIQPEPNYGWR